MTRNTLELTFINLPATDYVISFKYYGNPTVNNSTITVTETVKVTRAAPNQTTKGANVNDTATNYVAALAIDYPTFTAFTILNTVIIVTPNNSPIFDFQITTKDIKYLVVTGRNDKTIFNVHTNPYDLFTTKYDLNIEGLPQYENLLMKFKSISESDPYDVLIGVDNFATGDNMIAMFNQYLPISAPAAAPYTISYRDGQEVRLETNYGQDVRSTLSVTGVPVDGTDITLTIKKNNVTVATITKNMSSTLNDVNNVLIGSNAQNTANNFVNNLQQFNVLPDIIYFTVLEFSTYKIAIQYFGGVKDLWSLTTSANTTTYINFDATDDVEESEDLLFIDIPNSQYFEDTMITKTRGSELYQATDDSTFSKAKFKLFVWAGSIFDTPVEPYLLINKNKINVNQSNIYINVNPFIKSSLKSDLVGYLTQSMDDLSETGINETKWAKVEITKLDNLDVQVGDIQEQYYYALDGYIDVLDTYTDQNNDILMTGNNRYVQRGGNYSVHIKSNDLINLLKTTSTNDIPVEIDIDAGVNIGFNTSFVKRFKIDTDNLDEWVNYEFVYQSTSYNVRFYLYDDCELEGFQLIFKNRYGMLEGLPVTRRTDKKLEIKSTDYFKSIVDINGSFDIRDHSRKQFNTIGTDSIVLNTDWLPEYMNAPLKELMLSEELWIIDKNNNSLPVIRTTDNLQFKTVKNNNLIQYAIEVKLSHNTLLNIQ